MCEDNVLQRTGLTVYDHQRHTVDNYVELCDLWATASDSECPFVPVLQGNDPASYLKCIDMYSDAGVDLLAVPLVGVGSVCRRQHTDEIRAVFEAILEREPRLWLHGFGVKSRGLQVYSEYLRSVDTMSWSLNARKNPPLPGCTHRSCSSCILWAMRWRRKVLGYCTEFRPDHWD